MKSDTGHIAIRKKKDKANIFLQSASPNDGMKRGEGTIFAGSRKSPAPESVRRGRGSQRAIPSCLRMRGRRGGRFFLYRYELGNGYGMIFDRKRAANTRRGRKAHTYGLDVLYFHL